MAGFRKPDNFVGVSRHSSDSPFKNTRTSGTVEPQKNPGVVKPQLIEPVSEKNKVTLTPKSIPVLKQAVKSVSKGLEEVVDVTPAPPPLEAVKKPVFNSQPHPELEEKPRLKVTLRVPGQEERELPTTTEVINGGGTAETPPKLVIKLPTHDSELSTQPLTEVGVKADPSNEGVEMEKEGEATWGEIETAAVEKPPALVIKGRTENSTVEVKDKPPLVIKKKGDEAKTAEQSVEPLKAPELKIVKPYDHIYTLFGRDPEVGSAQMIHAIDSKEFSKYLSSNRDEDLTELMHEKLVKICWDFINICHKDLNNNKAKISVPGIFQLSPSLLRINPIEVNKDETLERGVIYRAVMLYKADPHITDSELNAYASANSVTSTVAFNRLIDIKRKAVLYEFVLVKRAVNVTMPVDIEMLFYN